MTAPTSPKLPFAGQYAHLFEDFDAEMHSIYEGDKALHDLKALRVEREAKVTEYETSLVEWRQKKADLETEMAELRGKIKSCDSALRSAQGQITQFTFRVDDKTRQIKETDRRMKRRMLAIQKQELHRRVRSIDLSARKVKTWDDVQLP